MINLQINWQHSNAYSIILVKLQSSLKSYDFGVNLRVELDNNWGSATNEIHYLMGSFYFVKMFFFFKC